MPHPTQNFREIGEERNAAAAAQQETEAAIPDELQRFIAMLRGEGGILDQFSGIAGRFGGAADRFQGISEGFDPLFDEHRRRQLALTSNFFNRRGGGNSTAALNALERTGAQADFAQLGRQDNAVTQMLQALTGQADVLTAAGETGAVPVELLIAQLAAQMSGQGGGGGGGGGCIILCIILTEELLFAGLLSLPLFLGHAAYALEKYSVTDFAGYRMWADPLVGYMRRWSWVSRAVAWAVTRYTAETASRVGLGGRSNLTGKALAFVIPTASRIIGSAARLLHKRTRCHIAVG